MPLTPESLAARAAASSVAASRFVVAAGHPAAADAARAAFERGGSVADAAIAASATLCVALPHATTIGGDLLGLYRDAATGAVHGLDAAGVAPARATPDLFTNGMPSQGARAAVVPGIVAGWGALHARFGTLPWSTLFGPAIALAANGLERSSGQREFLAECASQLAADAGCRALFLALDGPERAPLRQPALAATLSSIADGGAIEFYRGRTAQRLADFVARNDGLIDAADLSAYAPRWNEPLRAAYRGHEVAVLPPSSFGLLMLMQLAGLETVDPDRLRCQPQRFEAQLQAMRAAFSLGEPHLHDASTRLDHDQLASLLSAMPRAMRTPVQTPAESFGGTACVVAGDAQGNSAVLVQSVYRPFGSACADPATGVLLNNRMLGFAHAPDDANAVRPGKRPRHTLCPALVLDRGRPRWALASPGGLSQTVTLTQVLGNLVDLGMPPADAISQPRWCLDRSRGVLIEPAYPDLPESLRQAHALRVQDDPYSFGSAKVVAWTPEGNLSASADRRRDAAVAGC